MTVNASKAYRQQVIQTESMADIFVHAYDRLLGFLHAAAAATDIRDIEAKTLCVNQALDLLVHLQGALDFERGGEVAANLNRFYMLLRAEIFKGSARLDAGILRQAADHVVEVRRIWEQAQSVTDGAATVFPTPPQPSRLQPDTHDSAPYAHDRAFSAHPSEGWSA